MMEIEKPRIVLEEKNNGDFYRAVKMYKGAKTNLASTNKVINIYI